MSTSPDGVTTRLRYILLDEASAEVFLAIGGGNLSLGTREAARRLQELGQLHESVYVEAPVKTPRKPRAPQKYKKKERDVSPQIKTCGDLLKGWL